MMGQKFLDRWERHRTMGRLRYALLHAAGFGLFLIALAMGVQLIKGAVPEGVTPMTVAFFIMGGFGYGLIRFNMRERFYQMATQQQQDAS